MGNIERIVDKCTTVHVTGSPANVMLLARQRNFLKAAEGQMHKDDHHLNFLKYEQELQQKYAALRSAEEAFFEKRARVRWLSLGDQNTGHFRKIVMIKRVKSTIKVLFFEGGRKLEQPGDIAGEAVNLLKKLLGTGVAKVTGGNLSALRKLVKYTLNLRQA